MATTVLIANTPHGRLELMLADDATVEVPPSGWAIVRGLAGAITPELLERTTWHVEHRDHAGHGAVPVTPPCHNGTDTASDGLPPASTTTTTTEEHPT